MAIVLNPISGQFDIAPESFNWKDPVANNSALPSTGNVVGDARITTDTGSVNVWLGSSWVSSSGISGIGSAVIGGTDKSVLFVGSGSNLAQDNTNFNYNSTSHVLAVSGQFNSPVLDRATSGTLSIGTINSTTINIGNSSTVSVSGNLSATNLSGTNTGDVSLTAVGASPSANSASLSGQALTLQPADGTHPGVITSGAQTIGGNKTFTGTISSANIPASLTSGSVIFSNGTILSQDNAQFFWDDTNHSLGINTNTPQGSLQVGSTTTSGTVGSKAIILGTPTATDNIGAQATILGGASSANSAVGRSAVAQGEGCRATGNLSHAEGSIAVATGTAAHAEGQSTSAVGDGSHAEGISTTANNNGSHAEGNSTIASALYAHAEGQSTEASATAAHAEGISNTASGSSSHAEGSNNTASGANSHAEGHNTQANGINSHSAGSFTIANADFSTVVGQANNPSGTTGIQAASDEIFQVGIGTPGVTQVTGFSVRRDGLIDAHSHKIQNVTDPTNAQDAATKNYVDTTTTPSVTGDIAQTSFTAADNQSSVANVTGFLFANATVRSFQAIVSIVRNTTFAQYILNGIQKSASWEMSQSFVGDTTGITFSITNAGQLQYTSTSTGSTATIKFRALVTSV